MSTTKHVIITGASSGLGKDLALSFAQKGIVPILIARRTELLESLVGEIKSLYNLEAHAITLDLTSPQFKSEFEALLKQYPVHFLVNNAGFGSYGSTLDLSLEEQERMIQLNITALTQASYLFGKYCQDYQIKGKILNVASISAYFPGPLMNVYYASKAYVHSFSIALNEELKAYGIQVSSLCPGPTRTEFESKANLEQSNLFSNQVVMKSQTVVNYATRKFLSGKTVIIPGFMNKLNAFSSRFAPGPFAAKIIAWMSKEKK